MTNFDDHERRIVAVEAELPSLRAEAVETRALAAGADRDVADVRSELRGHTRLLTALRETQVEHYHHHKADTAALKAGMARLREELQTAVTWITADVSEVKTDVRGLKTDVRGLQADMSQLKTDVSGLKTDVSGLKTDVSGLKTDMSEIKAGMTRIMGLLEGPSKPAGS
jgi:chromosome segregation ATPase